MIGGSADLTGSNNTRTKSMKAMSAAGLFRPLHPLRHPRARHGRGHERHGAAWRHHPLFRHVPGVLRLLPAGDPARRADGRARHPRHDARLRSASARTARPTSRSSISRRCARSRTSTCSGRAMRSRRSSAGSSRSKRRETPSVLALTRQNLPQLRRTLDERNNCVAGAYEIAPAEGKAQVSIFATGSEVVDRGRGAEAARPRRASPARVVSVPCFELFLAPPDETRRAVIGDAPVKVGGRGRRPAWAGTPSSAPTAPSSA